MKRTIGLLVSFISPIIAFAKDANTPIDLLQPLPAGINGSANMTSYISGAFTLSMAIGAALAFVMITYGGIIYATTDALTNKQKGRKYIEDAIIGLIILLGAYALLNTINPELVNFNIGISAPIVGQAETGMTGPIQAPADCPACVPISSLSSSYPVPTKSSGMLVSQQMGTELATLAGAMKNSNVSWYITEGYTPKDGTGPHVGNSCHYSGSCVDIGLTNNTDVNAINLLYKGLADSGLGGKSVLEVQSQAEATRLKNGCADANKGCNPPTPPLDPRITVSVNAQVKDPVTGKITGATATHFHVVQ